MSEWLGRTVLGIVAGILLLVGSEASGASLESDGLVVIEAERFDTNRSASGHSWLPVTDRTGFVGLSAMQALPNSGMNINSNIQSSSPVLTYLARFTNSGTFNFWVRAGAANGSDDSLYVGIDGASPQLLTVNTSETWTWQSKQVTISTAGIHELNVWMREDGAYLDRILLAANLSYAPTGSGPPETTETTDNQPPAVQLTSPTSGSSYLAGTSITLEASATDPDGAVVRVNFLSDGALQGSLTNPPYSFAWTPPAGTHSLQAVATDNDGAITTSAAVNITVTNPPGAGPRFRYANSSNRIYVEGGGSATLTDIKQALANAPLQLVDATAQIWLLRANLIVADGSTLRLHGAAAGGDVNELRLLSNNSGATNSVVIVDADWGTLDLSGTRVTSWDEAANGPDTEYGVYQRAFIRTRSRQVGTATQQSTLNVVNSDIGYLGVSDPERYGLTWQVLNSAPGVRVFGKVSGSHIHHCQLGVSTWSADDVSWTGNEIDHNTLYGFKSADAGHQAVLAGNNVHDNQYTAGIRWASSSQRIYLTGPGSATLSDMKAALASAPLELVDPANKVWYLGADLFVQDGAVLNLRGPAAGGDVAELRLKSDNTTASNAFVEIRAEWGTLDFRGTRITSWDSAVNGPDTEYTALGRAFIRARSSLDPDGVTPRESRMDIRDCDISYLGYDASESYGLAWKVTGTHPDPSKSIYDYVDVYGDIINNRIHHNYWGVYTYGLEGGHWLNNEVDHNAGYGFDPHDDSDNLLIEGNNVHHNGGIGRGTHGIIASRRCDHLVIRNNRSWANAENGIMVHRHSDDCVIENNQTYLNGDSGIALFDVDRTTVRNNLVLSNANAGIRLTVGCADNMIVNNEFGYSGVSGLLLQNGTDLPEPDDRDPTVTGRCRRNTFTNNVIHNTGREAIKVVNGDSNLFVANTIVAAKTACRFETGTNNRMINNSLPADALVKMLGAPTNFSTAIFKGQPQTRLQMDLYSTAMFEDDRGAVFDSSQTGLTTLIRATGSSARVSFTGGTATIFTRALFVVPDTGDVRVTPTSWQLNGDMNKSWTAQASNGTASITYTLGDLAPDSPCGVTVNPPGMSLGTFNANREGYINFGISSSTTPLSAAHNMTVRRTDLATNTPPLLPPQPDRTINQGTQLVVTNTASDPDSPPAAMAYALNARNLADNSIVANAAISINGIITWTPAEAQRGTTNRFTTTVSDGFFTSSNSFRVIVTDAAQTPEMTLRIERTTADTVVISWPAPAPGWILQENDTLKAMNWVESTNAISTVAGRNQFTVSPLRKNNFFRLVQP